jgi:hypothetical protein
MVPDGSCVAKTDAPGRPSPSEALILPTMVDVVTCAVRPLAAKRASTTVKHLKMLNFDIMIVIKSEVKKTPPD